MLLRALAILLWIESAVLLAAPFAFGEGHADTFAGVAMLYPIGLLIGGAGALLWYLSDESRPQGWTDNG